MNPSKLNAKKPLVLAITAVLSAPVISQAETELDRVTVTSAAGYEQVIADAPASITVVTKEEIEKKAYSDVTDMLVDVPGVVVTGGGSASDISIRGMAPQYTMILIDGKRQNSRETRPNSDGPGVEQGWLPPIEAIERIEVIRGPMSSLYGSDAMGGVVNIITKKVPQKWTGSIRNEVTIQDSSKSGNIYQSNFYVGGPLIQDKLGVQIYGQKLDRVEDKIVNGFNKEDKTSGGVKLAFTPNEDHDLTFEASRTLQDRVANPGKSLVATDTKNYQDYTNNQFSVSHTGRWGELITDSYLQHSETDNPARDMNLKNTEFDTKGNLALGNHFVTAGFNYKKEELSDKGNDFDANVTELSRYQWAVFAEDEWMLTDSLSLTGGVRMTKDENYGTEWSPRLYAVWHATDQFTFKGGVSTGFKAPGLRQAVADWGQATGGRGGNAVILGNPDLKAEKSISQEISVHWDNQQNLNSSLTLFNTEFKDKITEVRDCTSPAATPNCQVNGTGHKYEYISSRVNVDKANMRGVEATVSWQMLSSLNLSANYTYTDSEQKSGAFSGKPLNKMPKHMANATLDWSPKQDLGIWSRVNYRGKTSEYLSRVAMAESTPAFTFVDLGANYKINKNFSLGGAIYNILDKDVNYEDHEVTYDGRRYWLSLTASF